MLRSPESTRTRLGLWCLSVLCAMLVIATPITADVWIEGVSEGEVVRGELDIAAHTDANRLRSFMIVLNGPGGTEIANYSGGNRVHLMIEKDQAGKPVSWNSRKYPAGDYSVSAYATERNRTGRNISSATVNFVVKNDNALAAQPEPAAPQDTPADETDTPGTHGDEQAEDPAPGTITQSGSLQAPTGPVTLSFASGTPSQRTIGDDADVQLRLTGDAVDGSDVLVIVWDDDRREIVDGVNATLTGDDLTIGSDLLDKLPAGNMELQAHYRVDGRIIQTVKHKFNNLPNDNAPATDSDTLPTVSFPEGVADSHTLGSTAGMSFNVSGAMPEDGDVLVIAWSLDQSKLVPGFAQVYSEGPWEIPASKLNLLPEGRVELQLRPRMDGQIQAKVVNTITVTRGTSSGLPDPDEPTTDPSEGGGEGTPGDGTPDGGETGGETGGEAGGETGDGDGVGGIPTAPSNIEMSFAGNTPARYELGSNAAITLDVTGNLPAGGDVLLMAWHNDNREMVAGFAHEVSSAPFRFNNAKLDAIPAGDVELQALLRIPGQPLVIRKQSVRIVDPNAPEPETPEEPAGGDDSPNYDGLNLSSDGFTEFKKSADTKVYYVAANGNDNNDGLSPERPLRSASAGYKKLRDGKPDWLLFKQGDTFRGNLGNIDRSGRSAQEPMLIGTYGNGPRPIFLSPDNSWARKNFNAKGDHIAFVGLHLIAEVRKEVAQSGNSSKLDPDTTWKMSAISFLGDAEDVLIEDCILEYFKFAIVFQSNKNSGYAKNIKIRRSAILNSYGHWNKDIGGHSSGIYAAYIDGLFIEENVWHSNGWHKNVSGANRTKFNHNLYIQYDCTGNSVVRGNIISRGSAHGLQLRAGGEISDNLFVENPLAMFTGRNKSAILRNVVLKSVDMGNGAGEDRGHGIEILPALEVKVENNIISQKQGSAEFAYAIGFNYEKSYVAYLDGRPYKATLKNNKIHQWPRYDGRESAIKIDHKPSQFEVSRNDLDKASGGDSNPPWIDPDRDVESYMKSIGKTASLDALIKAAAFRPRGQWAEEYSAEAINLYIRRGFDVKPFD